MPVCERDAWREQYFAGVPCPGDVLIPTDDEDAYAWYVDRRRIYDKLEVARSQGLAAGDASTPPDAFPVFVKPRFNMKGMSIDAGRADSAEAFGKACKPGMIWQQFLTGDHVSTDLALVGGKVVWVRHAVGFPTHSGMFDHWIVRADPLPELERKLVPWVEAQASGYTGMVNTESIGGGVIEAHLRFADQWPDLYGGGFVEALVRLYATGQWSFPDELRRDGFSTPLFMSNGKRFSHPPGSEQDKILAMPCVSSLQITFSETRDPQDHAMPAGGFRVSIVNSHTRQAGKAAIARLYGEWFSRFGPAISAICHDSAP